GRTGRGHGRSPCSARAPRWQRSGRDLLAILGPAGMEGALAVGPAVAVGAEVVTKPLDQVGWEAFSAVGIVIGERRGEGGSGNATLDGPPQHPPPGVLGAGHGLAEIGGQEQVLQAWLGEVGLRDAIEEAGPDDAA